MQRLMHLVRLRRNGRYEMKGTPLWECARKIDGSRLEIGQLSMHSSTPPDVFLRELVASVLGGESRMVFLGFDDTTFDGRLLDAAEEFLQSPKSESLLGFAPAAILRGLDGASTGLSLRLMSEPGGLRPKDPAWTLPLVVWRRESLVEMAQDALRRGCSSRRELAGMVLGFMLDHAGLFAHLADEIVGISEQPSPEALVQRGVDDFNAGRPETASRLFDMAAGIAETEIPGLHYFRAKAKTGMGRFHEARAHAEEEIRLHPGCRDAWQLLEKIEPLLLAKPYEYSQVSSAVESVDGYLAPGQERFLFEKVSAMPHDGVALEVGGYLGRSTVAMAFACLGTKRRVMTIDTFCGNSGPMGLSDVFLDVWRANLMRFDLAGYAVPRQGFSAEVLAAWDGPMVDFAFIDGSHEFDDVMKDLELVYPLVKDGGFIALHDIEPAWPGAWRVWRQTGRRLLTDHQVCSTLSCGRKVPGRPYSSFSSQWRGYAYEWAMTLLESGKASALAEDMLATVALHRALDTPGQGADEALPARLDSIARMPAPLLETLRIMLLKEASDDPLLNLWYAWALVKAGKPEEASAHKDRVHPALRDRMLSHS